MRVSRSQSTDRKFFGVVEAVVTDNEDDEGQEGRIKVRFPWFDEGMVTEWCRISQLYAGPDYGALFAPELGAEVLVAFVHGDMRRPVILGGLYNGEDKPPTYRASDKDEKMLKTKAGHQIKLVDTDGEQSILIEDSSGESMFKIDTEENSITLEANSGKLILKGDGIEIQSKAEITVNGHEITVDGTDIAATASGTMDLVGSTINLN